MNGQPKPGFYIAVVAIVIALVSLGIWRFTRTRDTDEGPKKDAPDIVLDDPTKKVEPPKKVDFAPGDDPEDKKGGYVFQPTFADYDIVPSQALPPVTAASSYKALKDTDNTIRFAINTWAGWGPIILANNGFQPGKVWKSPQGSEFKVELVKIDNIVTMRDAYTSGEVHIGWATLDMMPVLLQTMVDKDGNPRDSRYMPRIFQQIDWSSGGDGIVVRENIKTVSDLRGKQVVLAENSPSQYFLLRMLISSGVQPREVMYLHTRDAYQAATAFNDPKRKGLAGCVSWAPDIYRLTEKGSGNRMLVNTAQANKLIADIWFARADFARDYPDLIEALVRGIFDAMVEMESDAGKDRLVPLMAKGYELGEQATRDMLGDAHITNWAENREFFLNKNNPTNFERIWNTAYTLYSHPQVGTIRHKPVPFDQVMDYTFIQELGKEDKYAKQIDKSHKPFSPLPADTPVEGPEILGNKFYIRFAPNKSDPLLKVTREKDGAQVEELYDPNAPKVLQDIAELAGNFGAARIIIEGHTDSSRRNEVLPGDLPDLSTEVKKLSEKRAAAVKEVLVEKYKLDPNQLTPRGLGWTRPADPANPNEHGLNRRVEVRIYSAEAE
jgi:ABC-type nitrate/sulfonate/bicarbonate transport system substrate-binding protein